MADAWERHDNDRPACQCDACMDRAHYEQRPHWSVGIDWPADRWDAMNTAPSKGLVISVRGRDAKGRILEPMHYAYGGGEEQPPFRGWFVPNSSGRGYYQVEPVEWQPLTAGGVLGNDGSKP